MSSNRYPRVVGYDLVMQIGGGGFSTVFRAVNFEDHRVAACKVISLNEQTTEKERKTVEKEMRVHSTLKHANVLEFLNAVIVEVRFKEKYIPGIYMLMELAAGGDLFDKIAPDVGVGDEVAHYYFNQLVSGMGYIHSEGVCHRDLKPENILLDVTGTLKISDFGLSAVFKLKDTGKTRSLTERCGSLPYVAPELNNDAPYQAEPVDVWGMGVILFTLLAGNTPWDEPTQHSPEFRRYVSGTIFREEPWNRLGPDALSLLCGMLTINPAERLTLPDVFQHPWCMRPSQLANQGVVALAEKLTESLRMNGDLELVAPNLDSQRDAEDEDEVMLSATHASQFTQSLLLFSQTQGGRRYAPHLTRFYADIPPHIFMPIIQQSFGFMNVQFRTAPTADREGAPLLLRIGGHDQRKVIYKGWVEVERFVYRGCEGSYCVMRRDVGNPISWRKVWRQLIQSPAVVPHVLRK